ncbi:PucR family transcriptional regulator [Clostridium carnis]
MGETLDLIKEICSKTSLKLKLSDKLGREIFNNLVLDEKKIMKKLKVGKDEYRVELRAEDIKLIEFLEFTLNKLNGKENIIEELLNGRQTWDRLEEGPLTSKGSILVVKCTNKEEVMEIIQNSYSDNEIFIGEIYGQILIIGDIEEEKEYAFSLKETVLQTLGITIYIGISSLDGEYKGFLRGYKEATKAIEIGLNFKIKPEVYLLSEMVLEKAIFNLKDEYSMELKEQYEEIFKGFNHELILTLEEILKCNLSLTKASKKLYVHRNTLMYRVEKIKKETGLDIRNFKEATFLYLLYMNSKK